MITPEWDRFVIGTVEITSFEFSPQRQCFISTINIECSCSAIQSIPCNRRLRDDHCARMAFVILMAENRANKFGFRSEKRPKWQSFHDDK
jgi:hypothetical protein